MVLRVLVIAAWLVATAARVQPAHADTIALLPLDGEKRLEVYGQPVAAEIGRALKAQGFDVVVVGAKMDVPDTAQLIVDGTIKADKKNAIALSIRIRDPHNGTTLETLPANAASLTAIDKAAADLSARIVPAVRTHLDALAKAAQPVEPPKPPVDTPPPPPRKTPVPIAPGLPSVIVSVASPRPALPTLEFLADGLSDELPRWGTQHKRIASLVEPEQMTRAAAVMTVQHAITDLGVAFEVLTFTVEPREVPLARARVQSIVFERVVRTDTIVGDKGISEQELAARTAREILAIVNAQLRRHVEGWR
jgi:hypothetical protein